MKRAELYTKINDRIRCDLCARHCVLGEGETGYCRVRVVKEGELYTKVYGLIDGMAPDPIEKKPMFHFAPGSHAFSISTSCCNFHCKFCLNYHSSQREEPTGRKMSPNDIVSLAKKYDCQGISYTYTEPTIFMELAHDTAEIAHSEGMYNTFVTNGYETPEAIEYISPYLDAVTVDFKGSGNKDFYKEYMDVPSTKPIFTALKKFKEEDVFIELTNLIIPELGDFEDDTRELAKWIVDNLGSLTPLHLTAFGPMYQMTDLPRTSPSTLEKHMKVAKAAGLEFIYSGNVPGHDGENTYCPDCGYKAVERYSVYLKSNNLDEKGKCPHCGHDLNIAGVQWMKRGAGSRPFL